MKRPLAVVVLVALVVSAGCTDLVGYNREAPENDRLGWENGYWYDQPLDVRSADGLNETERQAVIARTMARVEHIRGLEFEQTVPVEIISRDEYRARRGESATTEDPTYNAWNNQVWEALFIVDEPTDVSDSFETVYGSSVTGFYAPKENRIVVISDSETPHLDRRTLSHELVHALQDQHLSLGADGRTQDAQLAEDGLVEGDANLVERHYEDRCAREWDCVPLPERSGGGGGASFNQGVFQVVYTPYAAGPAFVAALRERGGWRAVDDAYDAYPRSTEQIIHPETYPGEDSGAVSVPDRASGGWERFDRDPAYDTVGEASIYAMFWANGLTGERDRYNYSHPLSAGWAGDRVVPYRRGEQAGYVWRIRWDTEADARAFLRAYRELLTRRGAVREGDVYVIPEGDPYADAFRVTRNGTRVTIVNGPDRGSLGAIHG